MPRMKKTQRFTPLALLVLLVLGSPVLAQSQKFPWPEGKKMALSLSFDDARASNTSLGAPLLDEYGIQATFFVVPSGVERDLEGWKKAVASGHEIGNHSMHHPCSGNFAWSRERALENYTVDKMRAELLQANSEIETLLGVTPVVYAYPCGQKFVGKGIHTQSLVPLITEMFLAGRGWLDEAPVDPVYADLAQLTGMEMDQMEFGELLPLLASAAENGQWLVLAGHETDHSGYQTTPLSLLRELAEYANDPENGIWIAPIGTIAHYVQETRRAVADTLNMPQLVRVSTDGQLRLTAENGRGIGPDIKYMPDWKAFGWFTAKDSVVWEADVPEEGTYAVMMEWSVSDEEAGKSFVLKSEGESISGTVGKSGSWETFREIPIGQIRLKKGYNRLVFKAAEDFEGGALLDLRSIRLVPSFE